MKNLVAKHMNTFNRSSVVPDKHDKYLDELAEREREYEPELEEYYDEDEQYRNE